MDRIIAAVETLNLGAREQGEATNRHRTPRHPRVCGSFADECRSCGGSGTEISTGSNDGGAGAGPAKINARESLNGHRGAPLPNAGTIDSHTGAESLKAEEAVAVVDKRLLGIEQTLSLLAEQMGARIVTAGHDEDDRRRLKEKLKVPSAS